MNNQAQAQLNQLFLDLYPSGNLADDLVFKSLQILQILLDDDDLIKDIAGRLSLLLTNEHKGALQDELEATVKHCEADLDESLRGFSDLLSWVLKENRVRKDPSALLDQVPGLQSDLKACFLRTALALDAYLDLSDAFDFAAPKAATAIYLTMVVDIYSLINLTEKSIGQAAVASWLWRRIKDASLIDLVESSLHKNDLCLALKEKSTRDRVIFFLCLRIADGGSLSQEEHKILDSVLQFHGMLGIEPLVESGFIAIENFSTPDKEEFFKNFSLLSLKK